MRTVNFVVPGTTLSLIENDYVVVYKIVEKSEFNMFVQEIAKYPSLECLKENE